MPNFKKYRVLFSLILLFYIWFLFLKSSFIVNGNNKENIEKVIQSVDWYNKKDSIEIIKIIDSKNDRFVAFLYNNNPAYIHFTKNEFGNYEVTYKEFRSNESLSTFTVDVSLDRILVITNNLNQIAKLNLRVNRINQIEDEMKVGKPSALLLEIDHLPKSIDNSYEFQYQFFDENGKQIITKE
ncbi:hypothetical protein [Gottfriedia solisilvae]|uniref:hypothetical protein n=1 Tax=Gottfriedia solisilvae TaxID=1516104 RepID=UPI003D2EED21